MNGVRYLWLWLPAAALSMMLVLEIGQAPIGELPTPGAAITLLPRLSPVHVSRGSQPKELENRVQTILARPLFSPSRRPAAVTAAGTQPAIATLPRLTGVIIAPSGHLALFAPPEGKVVTLANGGSIGGYVVRSISRDAVMLAGPGGERELRTSFVRVTPHVIPAQQEAAAQ